MDNCINETFRDRVCDNCGHTLKEHYKTTIRSHRIVVMICGHDDYTDIDVGERIHDFCKCPKFECNF